MLILKFIFLLVGILGRSWGNTSENAFTIETDSRLGFQNLYP